MSNDRISSTITTHPDYNEYIGVWEMIDDCLQGSRSIKAKSERYLPKTEGMAADSLMGDVIYKRYLHNAVFPEYASDYFTASTGLLKQSEPVLKFPEIMESDFTPSPSYIANKSLYDVYSEVQDGVMKYNRCGVLIDPPNDTEKSLHKFPVLLTYDTYSIINWGYREYKGRKVVAWVLLNESYYDTDGQHFSREQKLKYRFLGLKTHENGIPVDKPMYYTYEGDESIVGIFEPPNPDSTGKAYVEGCLITYPSINGVYLEHIPFYCFTGTEMSLTPQRPICQSLCEACISIYGIYADYREYLYKQGFGILFGKGFETNDNIYTGVNKAVIVTADSADMKMVESSGNGLAEYRLALSEAMLYAKSLGLAILKGNGDETGVSVAKRQGFKTASLKSIARTVADGFIQIAKTAAYWAGLSKEEIDGINIVPNIDFSCSTETSDLAVFQNLTNANVNIMSDYDTYLNLKAMGKTSYSTYHEYKTAVEETRKQRDTYLLQKKLHEQRKMNELSLQHQKNSAELQAELQQSLNPKPVQGVEGVQGEGTPQDKSKLDQKPPKEDQGDTSRAVRCVETGKTYKSASEAGKSVGVATSAITRAVRTGGAAGKQGAKALHWKYA